MNFLMTAILTLAGDETDYESLLKQAKLSMVEAIDKGVAEAKKGVVTCIMITEENGKVIFSMDIAQGEKTMEMSLDAADGKVVETEEDDEEADRLDPAKAPKITLKNAIEIALKQVAGKPVMAELMLDDGERAASVSVFVDGKVHLVVIDADKGDVIGVKEMAKAGGDNEEGEQDGPGPAPAPKEAPKAKGESSGIVWIEGRRGGNDPVATAFAQARKENKPIVMFTFDDDDAPFLDTNDAFQDKSLKDMKDKFVFLKLDSEDNVLREKAREAFDNAPWVFVMDGREDDPWAKPLMKIKGVHKKGGGIPADKLVETLKEGLKKYADAKK